MRRAKLPELIANQPPSLIGMEAYSGAHHWAREFGKFGHTVRLMAPKFVASCRMSGKNDAADAIAICDAVKGVGCPARCSTLGQTFARRATTDFSRVGESAQAVGADAYHGG